MKCNDNDNFENGLEAIYPNGAAESKGKYQLWFYWLTYIHSVHLYIYLEKYQVKPSVYTIESVT